MKIETDPGNIKEDKLQLNERYIMTDKEKKLIQKAKEDREEFNSKSPLRFP